MIFDKEETEEQSVSKITRSRRNTLMQPRESFEGDTYDFMRLMDQTKQDDESLNSYKQRQSCDLSS